MTKHLPSPAALPHNAIRQNRGPDKRVTGLSTVRHTLQSGRATNQLGLGSRAAVPAVVLRWDCASRVVVSGPLTVKYR